MKWILTNHMNFSDFWTLENNSHEMKLRYNRDAHSMRLNAGDRRLYFLERSGFLQTKMTLKTEYSVAVGECFFIKGHDSGILQLDGKKYSFRMDGGSLTLIDKAKKAAGSVFIGDAAQIDLHEFSALLFAFVKLQHKLEKMNELSA